MSRQLPANPEDWSEDDCTYAAQRPWLLRDVEIEGLPEPEPRPPMEWEQVAMAIREAAAAQAAEGSPHDSGPVSHVRFTRRRSR